MRRVVALRRHKIILVLGALLLLSIGFQLVYPTDRALPLARLNGESVSLNSKTDIEKKLIAEYSNGVVETDVRGKKTRTPLAETGIVTDNARILAGVAEYPWYLRILPLSAVIKGGFTNQKVTAAADEERFNAFAEAVQKECFVPAKNAGAKVENGIVVLDPAKDGETCTKKSLKNQLLAAPITKSGLRQTIALEPVKPVRSDKDVTALLAEANVLAKRTLTIAVAGKSYTPDQPTVAGWLSFTEDEKTKKLTTTLSDEAVQRYLETIQKEVYIAPGVTYITTRDGIETSRSNGASGRGIDIATTTEALKKQVLEGDGTVAATISALAPTVRYSRSYSNTPEGLQALVNDLVKDKNMGISVRKLGDSGVHANGDKQYHPASTYKLYVAYSVLKRIDSGQFSWGQTASGGQTISQCLDNMIIYSDNACAEWFGSTINWATISSEARALGASNTIMTRPFVSTANDLALFLQKLESNQLGLSEPSRARLLDAMKRQVYRQGIPAGVGGPVADKVGFLEGKLHDAAIVYAPSGVYVLVIMTDGLSWGAIADAARQVHAQIVATE